MSQTANVYAQALFTLAKEEKLCHKMARELEALGQALQSQPEYLQLLASANLPKEERCGILDADFRGKVELYVLNFMKLLTEKGSIRQFPACCKAFLALYDEDQGILSVQAVTAVPMTAEQVKKLSEKLTAMTGKTIRLANKVDPRCLGGVRLDYGGRRIDGTVKNRLDAVGKLLKNTVL